MDGQTDRQIDRQTQTDRLRGIDRQIDTDRHTHTHTHTCWFLWFTGTLHRRNGFYTVQAVCAIALPPTLHLNLALTGDGAFLLSPQKRTLYDL